MPLAACIKAVFGFTEHLHTLSHMYVMLCFYCVHYNSMTEGAYEL